VASDGWRFHRKRLRGPGRFARDVARRYRTFFDVEKRLARQAIEYEQQSHFGNLGYGRNGFPSRRKVTRLAGWANPNPTDHDE
jgi:hypothetical protein